MIRKLVRMVLWWIRSLWRRYPKPKVGGHSRNYWRKIYASLIRSLDRQYNEEPDRNLLIVRRLMVAKRRLGRTWSDAA